VDAIFRLAATDDPWRTPTSRPASADTIARHFRRLTHAGRWERLLIALSETPPDHPLRRLEGIICRACRRAIRIRCLSLITLARRLNLSRALPGPSWMVANPILSEKLFAMPIPQRIPRTRRLRRVAIDYLRTLQKLLTTAAGHRYIPRALKACWP
jgi:transposase